MGPEQGGGVATEGPRHGQTPSQGPVLPIPVGGGPASGCRKEKLDGAAGRDNPLGGKFKSEPRGGVEGWGVLGGYSFQRQHLLAILKKEVAR